MGTATRSRAAASARTTRPRAAIYTRVSQDRAGGRSPEEQEAEGRQDCAREGYDVVAVLTDSAGASRHSKGTRKDWARAKEMIATKAIDVLVTWEASRAQRDLAAYSELRDLCVKHGVQWRYSGRTYDMSESGDRFTTGLDALLAEREADEIAARVKRAMRANAVAGSPHGRRLFGYQRIYDATSGRLLGQEPHPTEAPVVRRMFDEYLSGIGLRTICRRLNDEGITTSTGARWSDSQVRRILSNPAYAARRVHLGSIVGGATWPALVDADRFDRVQARFEAKAGSRVRQRSTARLLTGVGRCGRCGGKIHAGHDRRKRKFYACRECFGVGRDLVKLDAHVTTAILERLAQPDLSDVLVDDGESGEVVAARQEVDELRRMLDDAVAEFTAGRLTATTLGRVEADLLQRIASAERIIRRGAIPLDIDVPAGDIDAWWDHLTEEQRREVVGALIAAVTILPTRQGHRGFDVDAVKIEWRQPSVG